MSGNTLSQMVTPSDPSLKDLLDLLKNNIMLTLACHHIGTVQSFDSSVQTAKVTINYKKTYFNKNAITNVYEPVLVDYPILIDCPVIVLGGGSTSLTFPIAQGDECLVLFNDRDMDNWFQGSSGAGVATTRTHSFSDGIILVGLRSKPNKLSGYDSARVVLQNGTTLVGVGASKIKVANMTTSLNTLLQSLMTDLSNLATILSTLTTAMSAATPATVVAAIAVPSATATTAITALSASLSTLATQIGGLLE